MKKPRTGGGTEAELKMLRADLARTVAEQLKAEEGHGTAPLEPLSSRVVLEKKIDAAERALVALHAEQAQQNYRNDESEWRELQRQRALLVLAIRKSNKAIEERFDSYWSKGSTPEVPAYGCPANGASVSWAFRLLGTKTAPGVNGLAAKAFLRQCMVEGIISQKELLDD